jgi:hypothetical protein
MKKRMTLLFAAVMMALTMSFGSATAAFADPDCTGDPADRPASCHDTGQPGPGNFVDNADGGTAVPNHL